MKFLLLLPTVLLSVGFACSAHAQANLSLPGLNADIVSAAILPNGKSMVTGTFTQFSSVAVPGVVRLKTDGTLDKSFRLDTAVAGTALGQGNASVSLQADGSVLLFGAGAGVTGTVQKDVIRLDADGGVDPTFTAAADLDAQGVGLAVGEADGTVLVDTGFDGTGGADPAHYRLTRLLADGSEDGGFQAVSIGNPALGYPSGARLTAVTVQADGKILVAGNFTTVGGTAHVALARLNADGSVDASFSTVLGSDLLNSPIPITVTAVALRADGEIVVSGTFTEVDGMEFIGFVLLHADGSPDTGFVPDGSLTGASGKVVAVQGDNKILVTQSNFSTGFTASLQIVRLNADGSVDASFASPSVSRAVQSGQGRSLGLFAARVLADGTVAVAGDFSAFNATARNASARFNADGTLNLGAAQSVVEVAAQAGGFVVTRVLGNQPLTVTVRYKLKGSAVEGTDYAALGGTAKLKVSKTKKTVHVTALTNSAAGKNIKLTLAPGDGYTVGTGKKAKYKFLVNP